MLQHMSAFSQMTNFSNMSWKFYSVQLWENEKISDETRRFDWIKLIDWYGFINIDWLADIDWLPDLTC